MVNYDANGQLRYSTDLEGNRIPDFSYVGYKYGEELPSTSNLVPANQIKTISPIAGDNTAHIQSAIDAVGAYPVQSNGYRGIVRLNPGIYLTHNPVLWNVDAGPDNTIVVQKPPTAQNYAIGCFGKSVSGVGPFQADPGYIEGTGQGADLQIPSLYQAQLNARR